MFIRHNILKLAVASYIGSSALPSSALMAVVLKLIIRSSALLAQQRDGGGSGRVRQLRRPYPSNAVGGNSMVAEGLL